MIKPLRLEDFLTEGEIEKFHTDWMEVKKELPVAEPYEVHSAMPVISKPWQFRDNVFRARVLQKRLRRFNPYFNAHKYLPPFWHLQHYWMVGEQMYHGVTKLQRSYNNRHVVKDIPQLDIKKMIFWPSWNSNGHISVIGLHRLKRGSWDEGNAIEKLSGNLYDDKTVHWYGTVSGMCFASWRSYVKAFQALREDEPSAMERMQNLILDQKRQHASLFVPRTDLRENEAEELVERLKDRKVTLEDLDHFFSLYDIPKG